MRSHILSPRPTYKAMGESRDRSTEAFLGLYDRMDRRLMTHLVRRSGDVAVAAELWAECWAAAFEGWPRCRALCCREEDAWVFGIARKQLSSYFRSGAVRRRALDRFSWTVPAVDGELEEQFVRAAELDALRGVMAECLDALPPKRRRALSLRVIDELPYREVAARMGCSEQAARALVSRGLRRLAEALERDDKLRVNRVTP